MASTKTAAIASSKSLPKAVDGNDLGDSAGSSTNSRNRILIAAFVSGVIIVETLVFFFLVPSGEEVATLAEYRLIEKTASGGSTSNAVSNSHEKPKSDHGDGHGNGHASVPKDENRIVEHDLGTFNVAFIPAGADLPYRVEFKLFGELAAKDVPHLEELLAEKLGRFRNRLILEIRNASLSELQENQLGLIRRRILATSTELLGEPILVNVGFHDYQVIED